MLLAFRALAATGWKDFHHWTVRIRSADYPLGGKPSASNHGNLQLQTGKNPAHTVVDLPYIVTKNMLLLAEMTSIFPQLVTLQARVSEVPV
jgi:hypothetical protein